jgi:hypothetical protein
VNACERKKAQLMTCAEELIDELLEWSATTQRPNLTQIENKVLELRERFGEELAQGVVAEQEAKQPVPGPRCPRCGREMAYKGQKGITPHTWVGEVQIQRGYYYCQQCEVGLFPPGSAVGPRESAL